MKSVHLVQTARHYWQLFADFEQWKPAGNPIDTQRHRALVGFTALDATLNLYWNEIITTEWSDFLTLTAKLIDEPELLKTLVDKTAPEFNRAQWLASLRFIHNTGEPERFSPSIVDAALALGLKGGARLEDKAFCDGLKLLLRAQKLRNHCFHTGKDWNELVATECLRTLEQIWSAAETLHPIFGHALKEQAPAAKLAA